MLLKSVDRDDYNIFFISCVATDDCEFYSKAWLFSYQSVRQEELGSLNSFLRKTSQVHANDNYSYTFNYYRQRGEPSLLITFWVRNVTRCVRALDDR